MDIGGIIKNLPQYIKKYRYPLVVVLLGIMLLTIPAGKKEMNAPSVQATAPVKKIEMGEQLCQILGQIKGVGRVEVMLTKSISETNIYQNDEHSNAGENNSSSQKDTVIITDANRNQQALIYQTLEPVYRGAIVVCQGADQPAVKLAVVEAVAKATGLGPAQISVLKMK